MLYITKNGIFTTPCCYQLTELLYKQGWLIEWLLLQSKSVKLGVQGKVKEFKKKENI